MYVLMLAGEIVDTPTTAMANTLPSLEAAFARICCISGLSYRFAPEDEGWRLELMDVERPECSPDPIRSSYKRLQDAQHDLMSQAVDGRVRGHVAISDDLFDRTRIMRSAQGTRAHVA
ncbi:MAG TPA: hypothetical protein VJP60_01675 [Rhizomicrobium sp.]|nr:hypothetical protein [Rhizomicrobium sp.]